MYYKNRKRKITFLTMILGFKQKFPNGTPTNFKEKILSGQKIHSLRESNRFSAGMSIQMAYGVRTKHYEQFNKGIESLSICKSVQSLYLCYVDEDCMVATLEGAKTDWTIDSLIKNDGLTYEQFVKWFFPTPTKKYEWKGFIIHWTDFKY